MGKDINITYWYKMNKVPTFTEQLNALNERQASVISETSALMFPHKGFHIPWTPIHPDNYKPLLDQLNAAFGVIAPGPTDISSEIAEKYNHINHQLRFLVQDDDDFLKLQTSSFPQIVEENEDASPTIDIIKYMETVARQKGYYPQAIDDRFPALCYYEKEFRKAYNNLQRRKTYQPFNTMRDAAIAIADCFSLLSVLNQKCLSYLKILRNAEAYGAAEHNEGRKYIRRKKEEIEADKREKQEAKQRKEDHKNKIMERRIKEVNEANAAAMATGLPPPPSGQRYIYLFDRWGLTKQFK